MTSLRLYGPLMKKNFAYVPVVAAGDRAGRGRGIHVHECWSWQVVQTRYGTPAALTGVG